MKYSLDTNVIISHFKADKFSDNTDRFFAWVKNFGHTISSIVAIEETETKFISGLDIKKTQNPSTKSQINSKS